MARIPTVGEKYKYTYYSIMGLAKLIDIKVTGIYKLDNNKIIVRYKHNGFLFPIYEYVFLDEFNSNIAIEIN